MNKFIICILLLLLLISCSQSPEINALHYFNKDEVKSDCMIQFNIQKNKKGILNIDYDGKIDTGSYFAIPYNINFLQSLGNKHISLSVGGSFSQGFGVNLTEHSFKYLQAHILYNPLNIGSKKGFAITSNPYDNFVFGIGMFDSPMLLSKCNDSECWTSSYFAKNNQIIKSIETSYRLKPLIIRGKMDATNTILSYSIGLSYIFNIEK